MCLELLTCSCNSHFAQSLPCPLQVEVHGADSELLSLGALLRPQFPILDQDVHNRRLVWMDSGATSQKPTAVLEALANYYKQVCSGKSTHLHEFARV